MQLVCCACWDHKIIKSFYLNTQGFMTSIVKAIITVLSPCSGISVWKVKGPRASKYDVSTLTWGLLQEIIYYKNELVVLGF